MLVDQITISGINQYDIWSLGREVGRRGMSPKHAWSLVRKE